MRRARNHLHRPLIGRVANFVDQQRKEDGAGKREQRGKADHHRVAHNFPKIYVSDEPHKVLQANPWAAPYAPAAFKILKRNLHAVNGNIMKNGHAHQCRQQKKIELPLSPDAPSGATQGYALHCVSTALMIFANCILNVYHKNPI